MVREDMNCQTFLKEHEHAMSLALSPALGSRQMLLCVLQVRGELDLRRVVCLDGKGIWPPQKACELGRVRHGRAHKDDTQRCGIRDQACLGRCSCRACSTAARRHCAPNVRHALQDQCAVASEHLSHLVRLVHDGERKGLGTQRAKKMHVRIACRGCGTTLWEVRVGPLVDGAQDDVRLLEDGRLHVLSHVTVAGCASPERPRDARRPSTVLFRCVEKYPAVWFVRAAHSLVCAVTDKVRRAPGPGFLRDHAPQAAGEGRKSARNVCHERGVRQKDYGPAPIEHLIDCRRNI
mmetsp:Transcript_8444/g.24808  ORF Transcript_8444/g.24808 Transcript_8444/m.24808 type:complete len:292 (-) Transcript_8444:950-1825(-)